MKPLRRMYNAPKSITHGPRFAMTTNAPCARFFAVDLAVAARKHLTSPPGLIQVAADEADPRRLVQSGNRLPDLSRRRKSAADPATILLSRAESREEAVRCRM